MISADQATAKWVQKMQSAQQSYTDGINAVTQSPMAAAAKNVNGYLAGVNAAVSSGKYAAGLNRVSLQQWQQLATQKGAPRLAAGATAAQPKMLSFLQQFLPFVQNAQSQIKQMPNDTYEARKARMNAMSDLLHGFKRTK